MTICALLFLNLSKDPQTWLKWLPEPPEDTHQVISPSEFGNLAQGYIHTLCRDLPAPGPYLGFVVNPNPEIYFYRMTFIDSALESPDQARSDGTFIFVLR